MNSTEHRLFDILEYICSNQTPFEQKILMSGPYIKAKDAGIKAQNNARCHATEMVS